MSRMSNWFEERLGLGAATRDALDEPIPGGAKFWYALGSATIIDFAILAVTGVFQMMFYAPTVDHAYASVNFIRFQIPFGWLIHGIHFWAATVMVILVLLHLLQVFIWGAFKKPREMTWILGVLLLLATMLAVFTGGPLPWDKAGYWVAQIGSSIAGSIPWVGSFVQQLVFAGSTIGQATLTRMYALHVAVVPLIILAIFGLHMVAFRKKGAAGSYKDEPEVQRAFWPRQVLMDAILATIVLVVLIGLSVYLQTPVRGAADPVDPTYAARPEWEFLWLFQILKFVPGAWEGLAAALLPVIGVILLCCIPWFDRKPERRPWKRPVWMVALVVFVGALVALSMAAGGASTERPVWPPRGEPAPNLPPDPAKFLPIVPTAAFTIGSVEHGQTIFITYCKECHAMLGKGGVPNPGSADGTVPPLNPMDPEIASKDPQTFVNRMDLFLQNGSAPDSANDTSTPRLNMPAFGMTDGMTQPQIADAEAYVLYLNKVPRVVVVHPGVDPMKFWWFSLIVSVIGIAIAGGALITGKR